MEDLKSDFGEDSMLYVRELVELIEKLESAKIQYCLQKHRENSIMILATVPGERWEIEIIAYDSDKEYHIEIERFKSDGQISDDNSLNVLFELFAD